MGSRSSTRRTRPQAPTPPPRTAPQRTWREQLRDLLEIRTLIIAMVGYLAAEGIRIPSSRLAARELARLSATVDTLRDEVRGDRGAIGVLLRIRCAETPDPAEQTRLGLPCDAVRRDGYAWRGVPLSAATPAADVSPIPLRASRTSDRLTDPAADALLGVTHHLGASGRTPPQPRDPRDADRPRERSPPGP